MAAQAFGFREDKYATKKVRVVSLAHDMPTGFIYASTKYYQNISNLSEVIKCTRIWFRNSFRRDNLKKEQRDCLSCMWHSYLTWCMSIPNIIKLFQTVWELWPAQDFSFRGNKNITYKVKIVSLAHDTSSGPYLCLYPILSKYFKPFIYQTIKKSWRA